MPGRKEQIAVALNKYLQQKLRHICDLEKRSMSGFIAEALSWYMDLWTSKNKTKWKPEKEGKQQ